MSDRPLAVLEALGGEFRRLGEPSTSRGGFTRRTLTVALVLVLLLGGVAAAAILITRGAPLQAPNALDLQAGGVPLPSTVRLAGLDAADPNPAEPPWDIRLSRTRAGETCTAVGQVLGDQFGIVGLDHVFRALPLGGVDACGVNAPEGPVLTGARVFVGTSTPDARTVVNGIAGDGARSVTVYGPGPPRALRLGPEGSFITVYGGYVEEVQPRVVVVTRDGSTHTVALAQSSAFEVADPSGESSWQVSGGADLEPRAFADENCAQASEEVGRNVPSQFEASLTPQVCGRLGKQPLFVSMRRFVPGSGERTGFPWGNKPARTLVYGAASPLVATLTLTGAGSSRVLPVDPHEGVFLAVLDGHVDPRALTLTAHLRNGRSVSYAGSQNLFDPRSNRPIPPTPVPAYREPLPASVAEPAPPDVPLRNTVRETLRAKDPAGGPKWALRSWLGTGNPRANFGAGYHPKRFLCMQVGVLEGDRLVEPRPGSTPLPLSLTQEYGVGGGCNATSDLTRFPPMAEPVSYLESPFSYAPRPLRTVIGGMLRLDASRPELLGAGPPRRLPLDANHAFLLVLPGRYWDAPLRISAVIGGRTVVGRAVQGFPGPPAPSAPQARAPDPNGGAPWGFAAGADGSTAYGQIVDGRIASIEPRSGALRDAPDGWSGGGSPGLERRQGPVSFDTQGGAEAPPLGRAPAEPSQAQIERRTLPGRTIITGVAEADVVSVTLATPRDVRTLRPSGPKHVFIAVYDGQFFRGRITATVLLRDGRTVTQQVPNGPGGVDASSPTPLPLSVLLASTRNQLRLERRHPHRLPPDAPAPPPLGAIVRVIESRNPLRTRPPRGAAARLGVRPEEVVHAGDGCLSPD